MIKPRVVAILGTLDTKGEEILYIRDLIEASGCRSFLIDISLFDESPAYVHVSKSDIAKAGGIGKKSLKKLDRGRATDVMRKGISKIAMRLYQDRKIDGILALGGSGGTSIALPALVQLPLGFPKVLVTSVTLGAVGNIIDGTDVMVVSSVTDILGLNSINRVIFQSAVAAVCAMVQKGKTELPQKDRVGISAFGVTTPAVMAAKPILEREGYDVLVFSSNGIGGRALERLTREGVINGVLDLTITELADEIAGGILSAGPERLEAPGERGIPHVIAPGGIDVVNFRASQPVPPNLRRRHFYRHSPITLLMRTSIKENQRLGEMVASKLNKAKGKVALLIPLRGFSAYDKKGHPFHKPKVDHAFIKSFRQHINRGVEVVELDCHINDEEFASAAAWKLLEFMKLESQRVPAPTSCL